MTTIAKLTDDLTRERNTYARRVMQDIRAQRRKPVRDLRTGELLPSAR